MKKVFKGPSWKSDDYRDLLCLLFQLIRLAKQNPMSLEEHLEAPESSAIFSAYPKIQSDKEATSLICDTLRSASMNYDDPHQVEEVFFLAYGIVGPFASRLKSVVEHDAHFYQLIREVLVANLHNHTPNICIEVGRQNTPTSCRPSYNDLEESLRELKKQAA